MPSVTFGMSYVHCDLQTGLPPRGAGRKAGASQAAPEAQDPQLAESRQESGSRRFSAWEAQGLSPALKGLLVPGGQSGPQDRARVEWESLPVPGGRWPSTSGAAGVASWGMPP